MTEQKAKKKHHYIPVFYLDGFTNKDGCLYVYNKDDKPVFESSPEGIAFENDYFTFITPQGEKDSETVENNMSELEGVFAKVVKKILNGETLNDDDRYTFAFFVSSMMVRTPNMRENIRKSTAEMLKHTTNFITSDEGRFERMMKGYEIDTGNKIGMPLEEFRKVMRDTDKYTISIDKQYAISMALSLIEGFANTFCQMKWAFMRATDAYKFIAGDRSFFASLTSSRLHSYF